MVVSQNRVFCLNIEPQCDGLPLSVPPQPPLPLWPNRLTGRKMGEKQTEKRAKTDRTTTPDPIQNKNHAEPDRPFAFRPFAVAIDIHMPYTYNTIYIALSAVTAYHKNPTLFYMYYIDFYIIFRVLLTFTRTVCYELHRVRLAAAELKGARGVWRERDPV